MNKVIVIGLAGLLLMTACPAFAVVTVILDNYQLQPNMAGQEIPVWIQGDEHIDGVQIVLQVADGGDAPWDNGGVVEGPQFTAADLLTGTIAYGSGAAPQNKASDYWPDQIAIFSYTVPAAFGTITAGDGAGGRALLATFTVDTTGWDIGSAPGGSSTWDVFLKSRFNDETYVTKDGVPLDPDTIPPEINYHTGSITLVPEPGTITLLLSLLAGAPLLWWYRRRAH